MILLCVYMVTCMIFYETCRTEGYRIALVFDLYEREESTMSDSSESDSKDDDCLASDSKSDSEDDDTVQKLETDQAVVLAKQKIRHAQAKIDVLMTQGGIEYGLYDSFDLDFVTPPETIGNFVSTKDTKQGTATADTATASATTSAASASAGTFAAAAAATGAVSASASASVALGNDAKKRAKTQVIAPIPAKKSSKPQIVAPMAESIRLTASIDQLCNELLPKFRQEGYLGVIVCKYT